MNLIDMDNQYPSKQKGKIELPSPNQMENSWNLKVKQHFSKEMVKQSIRNP